jgi:hypothetical protein
MEKEFNGESSEWGTLEHKDTMELKPYFVRDNFPRWMIAVVDVRDAKGGGFSDAYDREGLEKEWIFHPFIKMEDLFLSRNIKPNKR